MIMVCSVAPELVNFPKFGEMRERCSSAEQTRIKSGESGTAYYYAMRVHLNSDPK